MRVLLIFLLVRRIIESMNPSSNSFFDQVSSEIDRRIPRQHLTIDKNFAAHIPAHILARYDLQKGFEMYCDPSYGAVVLVFVKKLDGDVQVDDAQQKETGSLDCRAFFDRHDHELGFGERLPARFAFAIEPPKTVAGDYNGHGDEAIFARSSFGAPAVRRSPGSSSVTMSKLF